MALKLVAVDEEPGEIFPVLGAEPVMGGDEAEAATWLQKLGAVRNEVNVDVSPLVEVPIEFERSEVCTDLELVVSTEPLPGEGEGGHSAGGVTRPEPAREEQPTRTGEVVGSRGEALGHGDDELTRVTCCCWRPLLRAFVIVCELILSFRRLAL